MQSHYTTYNFGYPNPAAPADLIEIEDAKADYIKVISTLGVIAFEGKIVGGKAAIAERLAYSTPTLRMVSLLMLARRTVICN